jgi:2-C-methyl-D-erythritol 4-phosphate cytidylyltransferase / 2-C-methyl-D-erythritol 2,4-cyclodiphosphate synthase
MRHIALVPAAGVGQRFGGNAPKQYALIAGKPMLAHTVAALLAFDAFEQVRVVVSPQDTQASEVLAMLLAEYPNRLTIVHVGGQSRAQTVRNGLETLKSFSVISKVEPTAESTIVWVHDAARPLIGQAQLALLHHALLTAPAGAILATAVADTLKQVDNGTVQATVPRNALWQAQTPQCFELNQLIQSLDAASAQGVAVTDEASAIEAMGLKPLIVLGSSHNFKVTSPEDAALMEAVLSMNFIQPKRMNIAIGEGMDVHALVAGRPLILGGVTIPHHSGLLGHSDADALLHAITDALLGAAGMGDIGRLFPDTDAAYAGADSQVLLKHAYAKVEAAGWLVSNVDATIVAQAPKMAPHVSAMQVNIAACLQIDNAQVNVKAKTNERLGWLGREEGIEVRAVLMLHRA